MEEEFEAGKDENQQVLKVLEALKQASHELQTNPTSKSSNAKALLDLENEADAILSGDPHLSNLSLHLSNLKTLINTFHNSHHRLGLKSFLGRRFSSHEISRVAGSIESEIQAWIDRESIENLTRALQKSKASVEEQEEEEEAVIDLIEQFTSRISRGFDRELQGLILKSKVFNKLESILCSSSSSKKVREKSAFAIEELIKFNKDVFVGQVLLGQTIRALISLATAPSLEVLCSLIKSIRSPLVDEIESNGEIPKIISFLSFEDISIRTMAMDSVLEIGYFGRKEAIEAMLKEGLVKKLMELQRSELGGDLVDVMREKYPFASCVGRFAVQVEVGEGLRQREKRAFKQEILKRVREASVSDAEAATIIAEVLWGASP